MRGARIGFLGDGQIGAMGAEEAQRRGVNPTILGTKINSPAGQVVNLVNRSGRIIVSNGYQDSEGKLDIEKCYSDKEKIAKFARTRLDSVTLEWENIPTGCLNHLEFLGVPVRPSKELLAITKHRIREKNAVNDILGRNSVTKNVAVNNKDDTKYAFKELGAGRLKTCEGGYDGKGQWMIKSEADIEETWQEINEADGKFGEEFIYEKNVKFIREASVIVARNPRGQIVAFDPIMNSHKNGILSRSFIGVDSIFDEEIVKDMKKRAMNLADGLGLEGVMAVEMFQRSKGKPLINEIAPRPHNSGHGTIEAYDTNQYTMQILAALDENLPEPELQNAVVMNNFIGNEVLDSHIQDIEGFKGNDKWGVYKKGLDGEHVYYIYGKGNPSNGRKMGHRSTIIK